MYNTVVYMLSHGVDRLLSCSIPTAITKSTDYNDEVYRLQLRCLQTTVTMSTDYRLQTTHAVYR